MTEKERCIVAIHDYGTRDGMTVVKVMKLLKADGFTVSVIRDALLPFEDAS